MSNGVPINALLQNDSFGALIAGLAMGWAILSLYIAWRLMGGSSSAGISLNFVGPVRVVSLARPCMPTRVGCIIQSAARPALHAAHVFIPGI